MGRILYSKGKYSKAVECFDKALEIAPRMHGGVAWINKAEALEKLEEYEKAVECYDKALEIERAAK